MLTLKKGAGVVNKYNKEDQVFEEIRFENVILSSLLWSQINAHLEDSVTSIHLILQAYNEIKEEVPFIQVMKVNSFVADIQGIFQRTLNPTIIKTEEKGLIKVKEEYKKLPGEVRNMLRHYVGNATLAMSLIFI